ncbi:OsmC family protein [Algirhabdus cladophorae]|uniref:OsmC family protein n=1 Tax=Algirhabdus cladophorae TaxID=3377108 RepID=UPI003B847BE0
MGEFTATVIWTGNQGTGTSGYHDYARTWSVQSQGKPEIQCSNDPMLGGDPNLHNPEDLFLSALASCHMLWYLHLASDAGIVVQAYSDTPMGQGETSPNGAGRFLSAQLNPVITVPQGTDVTKAAALHEEIHTYCFIARSVNFPVTIKPKFRLQCADT